SIFSGGSVTGAPDAGARATFTFSGTGASFIAYQDEWAGIANIYVDGTQKGQVDTYSSPFKAQSTVYSISGLSSGTHTLTVEVTGTKNARSGGTWVWVDAFNTVSGSGTTSTPSSGTTSTPGSGTTSTPGSGTTSAPGSGTTSTGTTTPVTSGTSTGSS